MFGLLGLFGLLGGLGRLYLGGEFLLLGELEDFVFFGSGVGLVWFVLL